MRFAVAWVLFWIGDAISHLPGWLAPVWYRPYNFCMVRSHLIQGDGKGPWLPPESDNS